MKRHILAISTILAIASPALAQDGTPEQRAACSPDVRKYCFKLKRDATSYDYQQCLEANRPKLSDKCRKVLDGQL